MLMGGAGSDILDGGDGTDTAYAGSDAGVDVNRSRDTASGGHALGMSWMVSKT